MPHTLAPPRSVFFGWKVVAASFTVALFAWGIGFYGPSVYIEVLHRTRGWPVSLIAAAVTAHFLVSAVLVANLAAAYRRFGIVATTRAGAVATVVGLLGWSLATAPWQLFAAALFTAIGWAVTSGAAINAMVSPWFDRRRPAALSHALNGASVGGVVFTPLWVALIAAIGFAGAAACIGLVMLLILWPLAGRYLRPTPESLRLAPDGDPGAHAARPPPAPPKRLGELLAQRHFITLSAAFALGLFSQIGFVAHLLTRLVPLLGAADAAWFVSIAAACAVIGRLLLGSLLGEADRRTVAMGNFIMQAVGMALLALGTSAPLLLIGCVLFGLGIGNLVSLPPLIAQREFAAVDTTRVVALVTAGNQAVFAFAPAVFGLLREATGGYAVPFLAAAVLHLAAAVIVVCGRIRA